MELPEALQKLKEAEQDLVLKDKEISLLINHCDTLIQQSNTLKLLNDFDTILDENKYLYDYIDDLSIASKKDQNNLSIKQDEISTLNNHIKEQRDLIVKLNNELVDLNFVIYNQNLSRNEEMINPLYLCEREEEIEQLKMQLNDKNKEILKLQSVIDEIKIFIANQSPYMPIFTASSVVDQLMILFKEKILCQTEDFEKSGSLTPSKSGSLTPISTESSPLKPFVPKNKKMKRLSIRS